LGDELCGVGTSFESPTSRSTWAEVTAGSAVTDKPPKAKGLKRRADETPQARKDNAIEASGRCKQSNERRAI
jgi:hypothetical protein